MANKKAIADEPVPFDGIQLKTVTEVDIQSVRNAVWLFMKRKDGGIVRVWISHPSRDDVPLTVSVEVEDH